MNDNKKHLYRIDPLKIKQKLYLLYPKGSEAHKMMAREEKIKEYNHLSKTLSSMPVEVVKEIAEQNRVLAWGSIVKSIGYLFLAIAFGFVTTVTSTKLEFGLLITLMLFSAYKSVTKFLNALKISYSIKSFEKLLKRTEERLEKLQRDIFQ